MDLYILNLIDRDTTGTDLLCSFALSMRRCYILNTMRRTLLAASPVRWEHCNRAAPVGRSYEMRRQQSMAAQAGASSTGVLSLCLTDEAMLQTGVHAAIKAKILIQSRGCCPGRRSVCPYRALPLARGSLC